ncbi:uncharacterized protein LOC120043344 [Salvelinus namaycush]|uniref:Uncharacterized protein LOC120043344 n=1 Tax=Salvelinus namaycush TaxID=8040 RepID=A0A8U0U9E3_SALNM|nr:uncharacterized protein LOC120043344 [Salvelinus namaycush]
MTSWLSGETFQRDKAAVSSPESSLLGQGSGPAQWPNTNRTVEAIFVELCHKHPAGKMVLGNRVNRWAAILGDYKRIRIMVLGSPNLITHTRLQLFQVNKLTLTVVQQTDVPHGESDTAPDPGQHDCREGGVRPLPRCSQEHITAASPINQLPEDRMGQATQRGRAATSQSLPPLPPPSLPTTSFPISPVSQDLPSTCTPLPPPASGPKVSRTTEWRKSLGIKSGSTSRTKDTTALNVANPKLVNLDTV